MKRANFNQRGFTLVELVFVIAIIVVLTSILLPTLFSQIDKSKTTKTDVDVQEIAAGLMAFFNDLDQFPSCDGTCDTAINKDLSFLAFGDGFGALTNDYPGETATWNLQTSDDATTPAKNNGANHLVLNDPDASDTPDTTGDYKKTGKKKWNGPYLARVGEDPFGRTYIAYVGAMDSAGTKLSGVTGTQRGWIISAGANNTLNTAPSGTTLSDDDQGFILTTK